MESLVGRGLYGVGFRALARPHHSFRKKRQSGPALLFDAAWLGCAFREFRICPSCALRPFRNTGAARLLLTREESPEGRYGSRAGLLAICVFHEADLVFARSARLRGRFVFCPPGSVCTGAIPGKAVRLGVRDCRSVVGSHAVSAQYDVLLPSSLGPGLADLPFGESLESAPTGNAVSECLYGSPVLAMGCKPAGSSSCRRRESLLGTAADAPDCGRDAQRYF